MDDNDADDSLTLLDRNLREARGLMLPGGKLGPVELEWIGNELRAYYDGILREPVPDRLLALLDPQPRAEDVPLTLDPALRDEMLASLPSLRAFAMSLVGHANRADDLVQETLVRAVTNIHRFEAGTNLNAWLFTILRNLFHSEYRKRPREVEDADGSFVARLSAPPEQGARLDFEDFRKALANIPLDQREALLLVGTEGLSYEEAAQVCGVAVGTIKSRVNRARSRLAQMLAVEHGEEFDPDPTIKAALQGTFES